LSHAADAVLVLLSTPACCSCWCCARVAFANFVAVAAVACFAARFPRGPLRPLRMNLPCFAAGLPVVQCSLAPPLEGCWNSNESIMKIRVWARSFESPQGRPLIRPLCARGPPSRRAQGVTGRAEGPGSCFAGRLPAAMAAAGRGGAAPGGAPSSSHHSNHPAPAVYRWVQAWVHWSRASLDYKPKGQLLTHHAQNQVCGAYTTERCAKYRLKSVGQAKRAGSRSTCQCHSCSRHFVVL
jgi:hypothetical protein